jgi:hypothetical protein
MRAARRLRAAHSVAHMPVDLAFQMESHFFPQLGLHAAAAENSS